jgi:hypothetical protein
VLLWQCTRVCDPADVTTHVWQPLSHVQLSLPDRDGHVERHTLHRCPACGLVQQAWMQIRATAPIPDPIRLHALRQERAAAGDAYAGLWDQEHRAQRQAATMRQYEVQP